MDAELPVERHQLTEHTEVKYGFGKCSIWLLNPLPSHYGQRSSIGFVLMAA